MVKTSVFQTEDYVFRDFHIHSILLFLLTYFVISVPVVSFLFRFIPTKSRQNFGKAYRNLREETSSFS